MLRAALVSLVSLLLLASTSVARASGSVPQDGQVWLTATAQGEVVPDILGGYLQIQPRLGRDGLRQILIRPAVYLQTSELTSVWLGYGWTPKVEPEFQDENRIWEQFLLRTPVGDEADPLSPWFTSRTRLEQRFIEGTTPACSVRLREMLRLRMPIEGIVSAVIWDEIFFNLNDTKNGPKAGFDQNRAFVGVNLAFTKEMSLDVGYMNRFEGPNSDSGEKMDHVLSLWFLVRF